ncbi:HXXEE domain-containing protein [Streptomyces diacarni]|uniref:HXXEE domain-containing protein n=1 Tax=Streptomyces diacarni TaxID=2800381 RepID=A0A367F017_9ACTN|nr:HXXEE domain-containing protein [Streptomyces diacarni]RCG23706.1 HXXEE domain-containing protein [Streptomyces diacarni]
MEEQQRTGTVPAGVTLGLFAAWALHDAEETAMMPHWIRTHVPELRKSAPRVPEAVWTRLEATDGRRFAAAVGAMAVLVGAAAAEGHRTGGRSATYQTALGAFGAHGVVHLAQAAATRSLTPGALTSPLVVIPFTAWARGRLRAQGILRPTRPRDIAAGALGAVAALAVSHGVAQLLVRRR